VQLEQVIGRRIAEYRRVLDRERREGGEGGLSQEELGRRLGDHLANKDGSRKEWAKQAVWQAERGERAFTAVELVAFALVLGVTLEDLLRPIEDPDEEIEMPSGKWVEWSQLFKVYDDSTMGDAENILANMDMELDTVETIVKRIRRARGELQEVFERAGRVG
jgi:transcriptional regulator with XRE-family HTH domain